MLVPLPFRAGANAENNYLLIYSYFYFMIYKSQSIERTMFYGAKADTFKFAAELRKNMTEAELILWNELKQNKLRGYRFKAQHPVKLW